MPEIHINCPRPTHRLRRVLKCPTCVRRRRMVMEIFEWYGTDVTCCGCGERWQDNEMCPRPFCPGWRKRNIEQARAKWLRYDQRGEGESS